MAFTSGTEGMLRIGSVGEETQSVSVMVDVSIVDEAPSFPTALGHLRQGNLQLLPETLRPKKVLAAPINLSIIVHKRDEDAKFLVIRYYHFLEKVRIEHAKEISHDQMFLVSFGDLKRMGRKGFCFMLDNTLSG